MADESTTPPAGDKPKPAPAAAKAAAAANDAKLAGRTTTAAARAPIMGKVADTSPLLGRRGGMGLAWVPSNVSEPGCTFDVFSGGKLVVAQVASEVAYDPAGERLRQ